MKPDAWKQKVLSAWKNLKVDSTQLDQLQQAIESTSSVLFSVRQGTVLEKGMGVISLGVSAYKLYENYVKFDLNEYNPLHMYEENGGLNRLDEQYLGELCERMWPEYKEIKSGPTIFRLWEEQGIVFRLYKEGYDYGPLVKDIKSIELLKQLVFKLWGDNDFVKLEVDKNNDKLDIVPISVRSEYIGDPDCSWYADRLGRLLQLGNRTIRLAGPSGAGKTTLAYNVGKLILGEKTRVLSISGSTIIDYRHFNAQFIAYLRLLQPNVVIIDDFFHKFSTGEETINFTLLDTLDVLKNLNIPLVILTHMVNGAEVSLNSLGLRPGRVDQSFTIPPLSGKAKLDLIRMFEKQLVISLDESRLEALMENTEGLTGAYLKELMIQIYIEQEESAKSVINRFKKQWSLGLEEK